MAIFIINCVFFFVLFCFVLFLFYFVSSTEIIFWSLFKLKWKIIPLNIHLTECSISSKETEMKFIFIFIIIITHHQQNKKREKKRTKKNWKKRKDIYNKNAWTGIVKFKSEPELFLVKIRTEFILLFLVPFLFLFCDVIITNLCPDPLRL